MPKVRRETACGKQDCGVSTGFHGGFTFGRGTLDDYGYWDTPCGLCARRYDAEHPEDPDGPAWPLPHNPAEVTKREKPVLVRPDDFRQDTPLMQLATIHQCMWGNTDNFKMGICTSQKYTERMVVLVGQLEQLMPFLRQGSW